MDASSILGGLVGRIVIRSNLAPPIVIENPFGGGSSSGDGLLGLVRPQLEIYDPAGGLVVKTAPAGEPSSVPLVPLVLALAGAAVAVALVVIAVRK